MAKTFYLALDRPPLEIARFRQVFSPSDASSDTPELTVEIHSHNILRILRVTLRKGASVIHGIRLNDAFTPALFFPYAVPGADGTGEVPVSIAPPIALEEPGESLQSVIHIRGFPEGLKEFCFEPCVQKITLFTGKRELCFERIS